MIPRVGEGRGGGLSRTGRFINTLVAGSACGAPAYRWINLTAIRFAAGAALAPSAAVAVTVGL